MSPGHTATGELAADFGEDGPSERLLLQCAKGHASHMRLDGSPSVPYLELLIETMSSTVNSSLHGGCNWRDPETPDAPQCGAAVTVTRVTTQ